MFVFETDPSKASYRERRKGERPFCARIRRHGAPFHDFPPPFRRTRCLAGGRASNRRERASPAAGHLNAGASAVFHELPGIALEVDGRSALTRRTRPRGAVVLTSQSDAVALLFVSGQSGPDFR